jgi:hypothetical protein
MIRKFETYIKETKELFKVGDLCVYHRSNNTNPVMIIRQYDGEIVEITEINNRLRHSHSIRFLKTGEEVMVVPECLTPYTPKKIISKEDPYGEEDWN